MPREEMRRSTMRMKIRIFSCMLFCDHGTLFAANGSPSARCRGRSTPQRQQDTLYGIDTPVPCLFGNSVRAVSSIRHLTVTYSTFQNAETTVACARPLPLLGDSRELP
jgi:hypothetical protein